MHQGFGFNPQQQGRKFPEENAYKYIGKKALFKFFSVE